MRNRITILKEKMLDEKRYASIEQARIITRIYKENETLSVPMKRALSLKAALEEIEIGVEKEELIVVIVQKVYVLVLYFLKVAVHGWIENLKHFLPVLRISLK